MTARVKGRRRALVRVPAVLAALATALLDGLLACFGFALPLIAVAVVLAALLCAFTVAESRLSKGRVGLFARRATITLPRSLPPRAVDQLERSVGDKVQQLAAEPVPPVGELAALEVREPVGAAPIADVVIEAPSDDFDPARLVVAPSPATATPDGKAVGGEPKWRVAQVADS